MGVSQRPAAEPTIETHRRRGHLLDLSGPLAVPELADIEVTGHPVGIRAREPTQEDVARGLHQSLALDYAPAVLPELALPGEPLEHRSLCLLHLKEERVARVPAEEENDPGARPHAADADHLAGGVHVPVVLYEVADVAIK